MTKGEIAEILTWRSQPALSDSRVSEFLNADMREHALLTVSQHNGVLMHFTQMAFNGMI